MREPLTGPERLALKATVVRWERHRRPADGRQLADALGALMAERDRLAEQVQRVEALRDRWENAVRDPSAYKGGSAKYAAALAASHLPDLRRALDGEVEDR